MYNTFSDVVGWEREGDDVDPEIAVDKIISHLQKVLGIEELSQLRKKVLSEATAKI